MIIGSRYHSELNRTNFDVIIIGSGISGLTLANVLSKQGQKVLVLEQHYTAGGVTHTFSRKGFEWDSGLHYVGDVHNPEHPFRIMFDFLSNKKLNWAQLPQNFERLMFLDKTYSIPSGKEAYQAMLEEHFPHEKKAIQAYLKLILKATQSTQALSVSKLLPTPLSGMCQKILPDYFGRNTYDVLRGLTHNEKLISVWCGIWGDYGLPPRQSSFGVHATIAQHYLNGASFPVGGSSEVARTIVADIEAHGGVVVINTPVKKILIQNQEARGVELKNGDTLYARKIVSSAGVKNTFENLIEKKDLPFSLSEKLERVSSSVSYLSLGIGINRDPAELNHDGSNIWMYQDYDHDRSYKNYLRDPKHHLPMAYFSFPCLKDPKWSERVGKKIAIDVLGIADYKWFEEFRDSRTRKRPEAYEKLKAELAAPYLKYLHQLFPQFNGELEYYEISTPLTVKHYTQYPRGGIYGLSLDPARFAETWLKPRTPIKNFYLTGQDILMNGVCGAMMSGVLTATAMRPVATLRQLAPLGIYQKPIVT